MASPTPAWDFYRSFLSVVREGSLSRAARSLGLTQPTLGRHMAALEAALGAKLFTRSQHGLAPTAQARALLPHAEAMLASAEAFMRQGASEAEAEQGSVRVTASEFVGVEVLPPLLADFRKAHPHVAIELDVTDRTQDLLRREADIAVRMIAPTQSALVARRIGSVPIGLYAHRSYIEVQGIPKTIVALARHPLIGFDREAALFRGSGLSREMFTFRSDNDLACLAVLRAGLGIGGCQKGVAARDADLVPVLERDVRFSLDMWLVMHEDLRGIRRIRLLYDHLARGLTAYLQHTREPAGSAPGRAGKRAKTAGKRRLPRG
jgi:DNA-binding transcriptional LysR family regulator